MIFMEQNLGPHMEQKCAFFPASESIVSSGYLGWEGGDYGSGGGGGEQSMIGSLINLLID